MARARPRKAEPAHFGLVEKIRKIISDAYTAGKRDALREIVNVAGKKRSTHGLKSNVKLGRRKYTARGTSGALIKRELATGPLTPRQIYERAKTPQEKRLSFPAIYRELDRGRLHKRYRRQGKKWALA